jgi:hypothetical protein
LPKLPPLLKLPLLLKPHKLRRLLKPPKLLKPLKPLQLALWKLVELPQITPLQQKPSKMLLCNLVCRPHPRHIHR